MRRDSWSAEEYLDFDVEVFIIIILKIGLVLGMIGHAVNLWCDRALSITPNGKITLATMKEIDNPKGMEKLYEGVDASVPMKSAVLGVMSLVLQFFGYILYVVALMVSICMGVCGLPLWALVFTVLPILIVLFPFKIIGTLHISAIITFLGWIFIMDI